MSDAREASDRDESSKDFSALHGNFIPLQSSEGLFLIPPRRPRSPRRLRSRSPHRQRQEQGVHLHLSLTDSQMDKLTGSLTKDEAPKTKAHRRVETTESCGIAASGGHPQPPPLPPRSKTSTAVSGDAGVQSLDYSLGQHTHSPKLHGKGGHGAYGCYANEDPFTSPVRARPRPASPDKDQRLQENAPLSAAGGLPVAGNSTSDGNGGTKRQGIGQSPAAQTYDPEYSPSRSHRHYLEESEETDTSSSVYSVDDLIRTIPHIHPLYVKKIAEMGSSGRSPTQSPEQQPVGRMLKEYTAWAQVSPLATSAPFDSASSGSGKRVSPCFGNNKIGQTTENRGSNNSDDYITIAAETNVEAMDRATYSPLTSVENGPTFSTVRKAHKTMVGHNGWLERTDKLEKKASPPKKGRILDALKRMAKEVAEATDMKAARRARETERSRHRRTSRMRISLDPRAQSLLYCELEFLLTTALDGYLTGQFAAGRLDADKYKKVVDAWHHKGRPRVVGFRYDLETQLDLVYLHAREFRFYGDRAGAAVAVAALLETMQVHARAMRVRTFCQPDSAIAKQLLDAQSLLNLLGCAEPPQVQLAEVVQFFKTVLEREQAVTQEQETAAIQESATATSLPRAGDGKDGRPTS